MLVFWNNSSSTQTLYVLSNARFFHNDNVRSNTPDDVV